MGEHDASGIHLLQAIQPGRRHRQRLRVATYAGCVKNVKRRPQEPPPIDHRKVILMAVATDDNSRFSSYAHPQRLVSTEWLAGQLAQRAKGDHSLVVIEVGAP